MSLGQGISDGLSGIVTEPMRGAEETGVEGFFKGVGIGVLGVAIKPTVGVFDMVARLLAGMRGSADMLLNSEDAATRRRLPRVFYNQQRYMRVYDPKAALVSSLMRKISMGTTFRSYFPLENYLVLVHVGHYVACIDYSSYVPGLGSNAPLLTWRVDLRMLIALHLVNDESLKIQLSQSTGAVISSNSKIPIHIQNKYLVLQGPMIPLVNSAFKSISAQTGTDLFCSTPKRTKEFGLILNPLNTNVPMHARAEAAVLARDTVQHGIGVISHVSKLTVADQAGIVAGDFLVGIGNCPLDEHSYGEELYVALQELPLNSKLRLTLWRDGCFRNVVVVLDS